MSLGGIQPEIIVSLVLILGTAGVALLCDFLKGRNEQLREAVVELRTRREEEQRTMTGASKVIVAEKVTPEKVAPEKVIPAPVEAVAPAPVATETRNSEARERNLRIRAAQDQSKEAPAALVRRPRREAVPAAEAPKRLEEIDPKVALEGWLAKKALPRPRVSEIPVETAPAARPSADLLEQVMEATNGHEEAVHTVAKVEQEVEVVTLTQTPASEKRTSTSSVVIEQSLWDSILAQSVAKRQPRLAPKPEPKFELIQGTVNEKGIPAGIHEEVVLERLLERNDLFTGLVVVIATHSNDGSPNSAKLMNSVQDFVRGLLREDDFACRTNDDDFVLLFPTKHGSEAQLRLNEVSERFWDFQLRGIGSFRAVFHWGDVQASGEPLTDVVTAAANQTRQGRLARRTASVDSALLRRKAAV
ncbi:MAG TPA: hypothetical protein VKU01_07955 [Bryobacteraceae bacterium]|nr:hypothetical protein [Bryobacteraceae bacterium]